MRQLVLFVPILIGCAPALTPSGAKVAESDGRGLESCKFLGSVQGSNTAGSAFTESSLERARIRARNEAGNLGATHVVWDSMLKSGITHTVSAKAYACPVDGPAVAPSSLPTASPSPASSIGGTPI